MKHTQKHNSLKFKDLIQQLSSEMDTYFPDDIQIVYKYRKIGKHDLLVQEIQINATLRIYLVLEREKNRKQPLTNASIEVW